MAKPTGHTPDRPDCILCGITMFGKPFEATEGLMCGDGMGCRRRALSVIAALRADAQCQATIGVDANKMRCEKRVPHVESTDNNRYHRNGFTVWVDNLPVRSA